MRGNRNTGQNDRTASPDNFPIVSYPGQYGDRETWPEPRSAYPGPAQPPQARLPLGQAVPSEPDRRTGGAEGNERLTAMTGAVLLILLAVECYTILRISRLLTLHVFLGMLLLGPVALKAGSVLYRFVRYYTGSAPYRRKGPPGLLLRVIGPVIMLLTACVFGSGIMLTVTGPSYGPPTGWLLVHRLSFLAWAFFIVIHLLAYVPRLPRLLTAEVRGGSALALLGGRGTRLALLIASLIAGLVIALLTVHLAGKWELNY